MYLHHAYLVFLVLYLMEISLKLVTQPAETGNFYTQKHAMTDQMVETDVNWAVEGIKIKCSAQTEAQLMHQNVRLFAETGSLWGLKHVMTGLMIT